MTHKLQKNDILRLGKLAHIALREEELPRLMHDVSKILGYVEELNAIDTTHVSETAHVTGVEQILRDDKAKSNVSVDDMHATFPKIHNGYLKVEEVFTGESPSH